MLTKIFAVDKSSVCPQLEKKEGNAMATIQLFISDTPFALKSGIHFYGRIICHRETAII